VNPSTTPTAPRPKRDWRSEAAVKIVVTTRPFKLVRTPLRPSPGQPAPAVRPVKVRPRFSAEWEGGPHHGQAVHGYETLDEAVGALIRKAAHGYETLDEVLDFFASLFGVDPNRTADVELARAVRFANRNPARVHPGVFLVLPDTARPARERVKGGAA
jgi:hypothetical protein